MPPLTEEELEDIERTNRENDEALRKAAEQAASNTPPADPPAVQTAGSEAGTGTDDIAVAESALALSERMDAIQDCIDVVDEEVKKSFGKGAPKDVLKTVRQTLLNPQYPTSQLQAAAKNPQALSAFVAMVKGQLVDHPDYKPGGEEQSKPSRSGNSTASAKSKGGEEHFVLQLKNALPPELITGNTIESAKRILRK